MSTNKVRLILVAVIIVLIAVFSVFIFSKKVGEPVSGDVGEVAMDSEEKVDDNVIVYKIEVKDDGFFVVRNNERHLLASSKDVIFAEWKNFIFFSDNNHTENVKIFVYDLKTGVTSIFYEQARRDDFPEDKRLKSRYVTNLTVVNDTLYFSLGAYMVNGKTFFVDLPFEKNKISHFFDDTLSFEYDNGAYWASCGFGDGPYYSNFNYILNPDTKELAYIVNDYDNAGTGEEILYKDKNIVIMDEYYTDFDVSDHAIIKQVYYLETSATSTHHSLYDNSRNWDDFSNVIFVPETKELVFSNEISDYYQYIGEKLPKEYIIYDEIYREIKLQDLKISLKYPEVLGDNCILKNDTERGESKSVTFSKYDNLCSNRFDDVRISYASQDFWATREKNAAESFAHSNNLDFKSCNDLEHVYASVEDCKEVETPIGISLVFKNKPGWSLESDYIGVILVDSTGYILAVETSWKRPHIIREIFSSLSLIED